MGHHPCSCNDRINKRCREEARPRTGIGLAILMDHKPKVTPEVLKIRDWNCVGTVLRSSMRSIFNFLTTLMYEDLATPQHPSYFLGLLPYKRVAW